MSLDKPETKVPEEKRPGLSEEELDRALEGLAASAPEMPADFHEKWMGAVREEAKKQRPAVSQWPRILSVAAAFVLLVGGVLLVRSGGKQSGASQPAVTQAAMKAAENPAARPAQAAATAARTSMPTAAILQADAAYNANAMYEAAEEAVEAEAYAAEAAPAEEAEEAFAANADAPENHAASDADAIEAEEDRAAPLLAAGAEPEAGIAAEKNGPEGAFPSGSNGTAQAAGLPAAEKRAEILASKLRDGIRVILLSASSTEIH